jgi:hypothetical protein
VAGLEGLDDLRPGGMVGKGRGVFPGIRQHGPVQPDDGHAGFNFSAQVIDKTG